MALVWGSSAWAVPIEKIDITGNERVETSSIRAYLPYKVGMEFEPIYIQQSIKALFATGLFHQVEVDWVSPVVKVRVAENPLVNEVVFEGNDMLASDRLKDIISLKPRGVFSPAATQRDAQNILAAYRQRGRFLAEVNPQIIKRDQNRVDVIYAIKEGEKTKIKSIRFLGNKRFKDADLREVIATKESAFWRVFGAADNYDPARLSVDEEMLRRHYLMHGYADFQVDSAVVELSPDKKDFFVTFSVTEGPVYDFGNVDVKLNAEADGLNLGAVEEEVSIHSGELYNAARIETNIDNITDYLGNQGFAFLDVQPDFVRNEEERTVDVTFGINPGPRVYVNKINIEGNTRTQDEVIRRELRLAEGDAFSANKLRRSQDRVNRLGYFEDVNIQQAETGTPDRVDLTVNVAEQSTGEFNIGAGFSSYEGLLATADIKERNFLGRGQNVGLSFALSEVRRNFNFSFTEPYFMNQELAAGVDVFNEVSDLQDESSYNIDSTGGAFRIRFPFNEFSANSVRVGYKEVDINNIGANASSLVFREEGRKGIFSVANTFAYDTRDSILSPTRGFRTSLTGEAAGIADVSYIRGSLAGSWHKQLFDGYVFSVGGRAGAVTGFGDDSLPIYEHFTAGGATLRGFERLGIGPRDRVTGDALGGKYMVGNNVELTFPLGGLEELGINGVLFSDGGIVKSYDDATSAVVDSGKYRMSAGAGIYWRSPVGPIRLEFGVPIIKAEEDRTQFFSFSIGSRF